MLSLVEYRTETVELNPAEAAELARLTVGTRTGDGRPRVIERLIPSAVPGRYEVQPGPYVGRFQLNSGQVVEVAGRFPFQDLAVLLGLGSTATLLDDATAPASAGRSLVDLIALAFVREAERIAGAGLVKEYQRRTFTRPPYPGVPSATAHLKVHAGRPDRLATVANRLTCDVPVNQLIAAAHRRLSALAYPDARLGARVRALDPVFRGITTLRGGLVARVPPRYREIVQLAELILDDRSTLPTGTGMNGVSVLFDMTRIWERFVGEWLRRRSPGVTVVAQAPIVLTDSGRKRTGFADFVLHDGAKPTAVYDAKYRPWRSWPSSDEIYQLYTYAQRLGVSVAALVYPAPSAQHTVTTVGSVTITCWAVPIGKPDQN